MMNSIGRVKVQCMIRYCYREEIQDMSSESAPSWQCQAFQTREWAHVCHLMIDSTVKENGLA